MNQLLWPPCVADMDIIFLSCGVFLSFFFFYPSPNLSGRMQIGCLPYLVWPWCPCPHNMVNFGPLAAEIVSLVWGTPANVHGFRVLAALLHGTLVVGVSQTLRR